MDSIRVVLSAVVLLLASYLILFRKTDRKANDWAFWALGVIMGYWLGP